jgi:hypothetical protein
MDSLIQLVKNNDIIKVALILGAIYLFMQFYHKENLDNIEGAENVKATPVIAQPPAPTQLAQTVTPQQQMTQVDKVIAGKTALTTEDLLPKYDDANDFAKQNPVSKLLQETNFLTSGYHQGINTIVSSNKIPYHDIRSVPPIPKAEAGPWNQSSYENAMGSGRKYLEIGQ